jgi:hypothetical protein
MAPRPELAFIVGSPRSGTTWLQMLLLQHPAIVSLQETHVFSEWITPLLATTSRQREAGRNVGLSATFDNDQIVDVARSIYGAVIDRAIDGHPDAGVFVEKTPGHVRHVRSILELYPDATILHVVRDPRATAASIVAASQSWGRTWAPSDVASAARLWRRAVVAGLEIPQLTERTMTVRYEDLTADGPAVLGRVLTALDLRSDAEECRAFVAACTPEALAGGGAVGPTGMRGPVAETARRAVADGWRTELSQAEVRAVEWICRVEMEQLGYEPESNSTTRALSIPLATGSAKAAVRRGLSAVTSGLEALGGRLR